MRCSLVQPNFRQGGETYAGYWLPYSVATVYAYSVFEAGDEPEFGLFDLVLNQLVFRRDPIPEIAEKILGDDFVLFSNYGWNWEYNKALAQAVKAISPSTHILFGGVNVSDWRTEEQFSAMPFVDTIIVNEGEQSFNRFLHDWQKGVPERIYWGKRLRTLDTPSPYLHGMFDRIIEENPSVSWSAVIETNRGCPFQCTFCDWGGLTQARVCKVPEQRVKEEIEWLGKNKMGYVMLSDANFGIHAERDNQTADWIIDVQRRTGYPETVNAQWFKNSKESVVQLAKKFIESGLNRGVTMSVQSMNSDVLKAIKRKNMEVSHLKTMMELLKQEGVHNYTELILPLPLETPESWRSGLIEIIELGQHTCIESHIHHVFENAESNFPEHRETYGLQTRTLTGFMMSNQALGGPGDVPEKNELVIATDTMSYKEFLDSWMYSWMIIGFHMGGFTQLIARYLNRASLMSYRDFYDELYGYLRNSGDFLGDQFRQARDALDRWLNDGFVTDFQNSDIRGYNTIWNSTRIFHENRDAVWREINDHFRPEPEIAVMQRHFVTRHDTQYPIEVTMSHNWWDYIEGAELSKTPTTYQFATMFEWESKDAYYDHLYFQRRQGFGKCEVKGLT
jgi:hypothetical protein